MDTAAVRCRRKAFMLFKLIIHNNTILNYCAVTLYTDSAALTITIVIMNTNAIYIKTRTRSIDAAAATVTLVITHLSANHSQRARAIDTTSSSIIAFAQIVSLIICKSDIINLKLTIAAYSAAATNIIAASYFTFTIYGDISLASDIQYSTLVRAISAIQTTVKSTSVQIQINSTTAFNSKLCLTSSRFILFFV